MWGDKLSTKLVLAEGKLQSGPVENLEHDLSCRVGSTLRYSTSIGQWLQAVLISVQVSHLSNIIPLRSAVQHRRHLRAVLQALFTAARGQAAPGM